MLKIEVTAAIRLGLEITKTDGEFGPAEQAMLHRFCGLLGLDPTRDISPRAVAEVDPYATITSQESFSLSFLLMAAVAAADGILQDEEYAKITLVLGRFRERSPAVVQKLEEKLTQSPEATRDLILGNILHLASGDPEYGRLAVPLDALITRLRADIAAQTHRGG